MAGLDGNRIRTIRLEINVGDQHHEGNEQPDSDT